MANQVTRGMIKATIKYHRTLMGELLAVDYHNAKGTIGLIMTLARLEIVQIKSEPWLNNDHFVVEFVHED
jgi:hypothetical protein